MSISLSSVDAFKYSGADAIGIDPSTGNVFLSNINLPSPNVTDWRIDQYTGSGDFVSSFTTDQLQLTSGIPVLPNGNLLMLDLRSTRVAEFTKNGQLAAGGIDFTNPILFADFDIGPGMLGLAYDAKSDTVFTSDFYGPRIYSFDRQGNLKTAQPLDLTGVLAKDTEFRGITIDPATGNFFVSTALEQIPPSPTSAPTNKIFEITPSGQLLQTIDVGTDLGYKNAEGIAFDPTTRTLYLSLDDDDANGVKYEYDTRRNWVASYRVSIESIANDPGINENIPGTAANDTYLCGLGNDIINGVGGDDILDGGVANDIINGGQGNDQMLGGSGTDFARGGQGNDYISGGSGIDTLLGERGNDIIFGDEGDDILDGGAGDDLLYGGMGNDNVTGGVGRDVFALAVGSGTDSINDFTAGEDSFQLRGGLTFEQLTFTLDNGDDGPVSIRFVDTGEILANVTGATTKQLFTRTLFSVL
jgi:Ca2+-binding RTX toxin-like protein